MVKLRANIKLWILISAVFLPYFCFGANSIYHPNGKIAWTGGSANAYHANGKTAWYGFKSSNVYHDNGKAAWYGFKSSNLYHSNGKAAWYGFKSSNVYHENGKAAWYGFKGSNVYHANGKVAWYGYKGASCYDENGKYLGTADSVWISIGNGSWLFVSAEEEDVLFLINLYLGPGFYFQTVENEEQYLYIYDHQIDLTK